MKNRKLTPKQECFVNEYLISLNSADAARKAGYPARTANRVGSENLSKPVIADAIAKAMAQRSEETKITAESVLKNLHEFTEVCMARKPTKKAVRDVTGEIKEIDVLEFNSTGAARGIEMMMKHTGGFEKDNQQASNDFIMGIRSLILTSNALPKDQAADIARQRAERDALTQDSK